MSEIVECSIVAWHPKDGTDGKFSDGYARILKSTGVIDWRRSSVHVTEHSIISLGIETMKRGTKIRCVIPDFLPNGRTSYGCHSVEIYREDV